MWHILENKKIQRQCRKTPHQVLKKYELWKDLVFRHDPGILDTFPGFHDEKLIGEKIGQRSSRLSLQYRVLYTIKDEEVTVFVIEIIPHKY